MDDPGDLTLDDVAGRLDVHYQTVYRWVRSGRLRAHQVGGRYVVDADDLAEFEARRSAPTVPPKPSPTRLGRQQKAMQRALFDGNETDALTIARTLVSNRASVADLIESVIAPSLVEIGAAWRRGEVTIFVEHRATAIVERLLGAISPNPRGRRRGVAIVAALAGDRHALPTAMATAVLREDHWTVEHLGADIPADEVERFAASLDLDLIALSATGDEAVRAAETAGAELEARLGVPVLVARPGVGVGELCDMARTATE